MDIRSESELPLERRFNSASAEFRPEVRSAGDDNAHIAGYASVFNKLSRKLGGFVERVDSRAFNDWAAQGWDGVVARYQHSDDFILGTIAGRTLTLRTDATGLWYDVIPPSFRQDVIELCQRGDVSSSSFAFRTPEGGDDWSLSDFNYPLRTLLAIELVDVAPVVTPAYPDATASATGAVESLARRFSADPTEIRSLLDHNQGVKLFKRSGRPPAPVAPPEPEIRDEEVPVDFTEDEELRAWYAVEVRAKYDSGKMQSLAKSGAAMKNESGEPSYPIADEDDLKKAIRAVGRGGSSHDAIRRHIISRAKALGLSDLIPGEWSAGGTSKGAEKNDAEGRADAMKKPAKPAKAAPGDDEADAEGDEDEDEDGEEAEDDEGEARAGAKAPAKPFTKKPMAGDDEDDEDEEDDEEDDEDEAGAAKGAKKGAMKGGLKKAVKKAAGPGDKSGKVTKGLPPWLQEKQKRMYLDLMEKRHDPYVFNDETGEAA